MNRRMPNGTYWWCERGIKFPLLDFEKTWYTRGWLFWKTIVLEDDFFTEEEDGKKH